MPHLFGPVLSSRLGRSLGLDLLGDRICSFDCIYCECGTTRTLTCRRAAYVPAGDILAELQEWADQGHARPDHVTLGGMGEPALNSEMGDVIEGVRRILPQARVAVLTNATCLGDPEAARQTALADVVLPSLDSLEPGEFRAVNRPHRDVDLKALGRNLLEFRHRFKGQVWLEVLLVRGYNDSTRNLGLLAGYCQALRPHRVDVVTLTRPGALSLARPVDQATLTRWREGLGHAGRPAATTTSANRANATTASAATQAKTGFHDYDPVELEARVLSSLARRPQTGIDLAGALEARPGPLQALLDDLVRSGRVHARQSEGETFYFAPGADSG